MADNDTMINAEEYGFTEEDIKNAGVEVNTNRQRYLPKKIHRPKQSHRQSQYRKITTVRPSTTTINR